MKDNAINHKTGRNKSQRDDPHQCKPITSMSEGSHVIICEIKGEKTFQRRAASMGLAPGIDVEILKSSMLKGPLIIGFLGTRLALGHGMAEKVLCRKPN